MKNFLFNMALSMNRLASGDSSIKDGGTKITSLDGLVKTFTTVFRYVLGPILSIIGIAGVGYAVYLGIQYAKAEDASKRKEVQGRLIGAVIGAVIIIAGAVICFALDWVGIFNSFVDNSKTN